MFTVHFNILGNVNLKTYLPATLYAFVLAEIAGFSLNLLKFQQEFLSLRFYLRSWDVHFSLLLLCSFLAFLFFTLARRAGHDSLNKAKKNLQVLGILANILNGGLIGFLLLNSQVVERLGLTMSLTAILLFSAICIASHLIFLRKVMG